MTKQDDPASLAVSVENLGGIQSCHVTLDRGVTVLTGRNATNRTSLLRAVGAGLGGSSGELKTDADAGEVTLSFDGDEYARTFERDGGSVRTGGDPYADDGTLVDGFSCLLADNPARAAVERGDGDALREFIMRPVDTAEIKATIERKQEAVRTVRADLESAREEADGVPGLERRLEERREDLSDVRSELQDLRETVSSVEADVDDVEAAEAVVEDLADAREELERVETRLETQRKALDSLREERGSVAAELEATAAPEAERERLEEELQDLQRRERDLETQVNSLLSIVEFNEQLLDEDGVPGVAVDDPGKTEADPDSSADDVTGQLDPGGRRVTCWTCGTPVERGAIDGRLDDLRDVVDEKRSERNELRTEIDERRSELRAIRSSVQERERLQAKLDDVDAEIDERESRIDDLEDRESELRERVSDLEERAAESDDLRDSALLERYQRLSELEYERGQLEESVASLEDDLESAREAAERAADLEAELETHREDLAAARDRIERLERAAIETFNDHMATVLDLLDYGNVERVWIERKTGGEGAGRGPGSGRGTGAGSGPETESTFALHVVRSGDDGAVYEDSVDHLSESERAVIGLVVALAGYLVHDVHESVPVMALDSLEAIDADRIAALVEYFAEFVPYLVVALLPEDAAALPEAYDREQMGEVPA
jgi:DNA repair ATPase RecN